MARSSIQSLQRYPLTAIFGTEANVRILRELSRGDGQVSAPALIRMTKLSKSSVAHGLAQLESLGIIRSSGSFRTHLYQLNTRHPFHSTIDKLFDAEANRFETIMASIRETAVMAGPSLIAVWLYGSVARGEDHVDSDLDLAVVAAGENVAPAVSHLRAGLAKSSKALGFTPSIVGLNDTDILRLNQEDDPWWRAILKDARPLLGPTPEQRLSHLMNSATGRAVA